MEWWCQCLLYQGLAERGGGVQIEHPRPSPLRLLLFWCGLGWGGAGSTGPKVSIPRNGVFFVLCGLTALPGWWGHGLHRTPCPLKSHGREAHRKLPQVSYGTALFLWYVCHTAESSPTHGVLHTLVQTTAPQLWGLLVVSVALYGKGSGTAEEGLVPRPGAS